MSAPGRLTLALVVALALAGIGAGAASAWHPADTEAEGHERALADAQRREGLLRIPPGAKEVSTLPGRLGLGKPPVPTSSRWIDLASRWRSPQPMAKVIAYFQHHRPRGASIEDEGAQIYRGRAIEHDLLIGWYRSNYSAEERVAYLRIVPDGSGSAFRIDTVASWERADPSADVIPVTGFLKIEVTHDKPEHTRQVAEITDRATIASVAATVNGLPFYGPKTKSCPETDTGELYLTFRTAPKGKRVASVRQELPACGYGVEPEVGRKFSHERTEGQKLLEAVEPLLPAPEQIGEEEGF